MKTKLLVILLLLVPLLGFTTDGVKIKMNKKAGSFELTEVETIKILEDKPKEDFLKLAEINFEPKTKMKPEEFDKVMKEEAAKLGAQALYYKIKTIMIRKKRQGPNIRGRIFKVKVKTGIAIRFEK